MPTADGSPIPTTIPPLSEDSQRTIVTIVIDTKDGIFDDGPIHSASSLSGLLPVLSDYLVSLGVAPEDIYLGEHMDVNVDSPVFTVSELLASGLGGPAPTPPPVDVPPVDVPPVDVPPVDVPPVDVPPVDVPPVTPIDTPPVDVPPVDAPPTDTPPVDVPPVDPAPVDVPTDPVPPVDPPVYIPPADSVPLVDPPVDAPPPVDVPAPVDPAPAPVDTPLPVDAPPVDSVPVPPADVPPVDPAPVDVPVDPPVDPAPVDVPPPADVPADPAPTGVITAPLYTHDGPDAPDVSWQPAAVTTPDDAPLYTFAGDSEGNPPQGDNADGVWHLYTGETKTAPSFTSTGI